jgi:putative sugar O-methyltransferase
MMSCAGNASIEYLAAESKLDDAGASSHWRHYHSDFGFRGDGFDGLQGFGGSARPYKGLRGVVHERFLQRYRSMGIGFSAFRTIDELAGRISARERRAYDLDMLRQTLTLAFLKEHLVAGRAAADTTACVIGDGFASMTALLLASDSANRVILVNLTKTLLVDLWYLRLWMGGSLFDASVDLVTDESGLMDALAKTPSEASRRVIAIQAVHHELLRECPIDLTINIASMQEMDPPVVAEYFSHLRHVGAQRDLYFYCCNREEKSLPDGTVTRFAEYPWDAADRILVDELCPWHQQYYSVIPPFYRPYDGPHRHRLAALAGCR